MTSECDILIIGAGPAGLTAAWELAQSSSRRVLLVDAGPDLSERGCPALRANVCPSCRHCNLLQGVGGASGIVGGKLCYFPAGARLAEHVGFTSAEANDAVVALMHQLSLILPRPGHTDRWTSVHDAIGSPFALKSYEAFPILADDLRLLFEALRGAAMMSGVKICPNTTLRSLARGAGTAAFQAELDKGADRIRLVVNEAVVLATGRSTSPWLTQLYRQLGVKHEMGSVDVGVRLECDAGSLADYLSDFEDPKLLVRPGSDREVRTLCWCRGGSMTVTSMAGYQLVDGHFGLQYSDRTSVSIVARRPVASGWSSLDFAASLVGYSINQKPMQMALAEFLGRSSRNRPLGLSVVAPCRTNPMRTSSFSRELLLDLQEFLTHVSDHAGANLLDDRTAVVFGPVIDQQWAAPQTGPDLQTNVPGLFVAGDIQGRARGIVQAMFSGWIVGRRLSGADSRVHSRVQLEATR